MQGQNSMRRILYTSNMNGNNKVSVNFAAIEPYVVVNMPLPVERQMAGREWVSWGDSNAYPDYLLALYKSVPTLGSVIGGCVDYITGDGIAVRPFHQGLADGAVNLRGDTVTEQVRDLARDWEIYGGFALQVIRDRAGRPVELYYIDMRYLRSDRDNEVFYYSESWGKAGRKDVKVYPKWINIDQVRWQAMTDEERNRHASGIILVKSDHTQVYPSPGYASAVPACEIEKCIDQYHLNAIGNGFAPSIIINFNNGVPTDEIKKQIERDVMEKFCGPGNAGRILLSWNMNRENQTTFQVPQTHDFGERYNALAARSRQQIFTAFRANPNLFGIPTENNGFSNEQYEESFRLFNRTHIRPVQRLICSTYDKILGTSGSVTITPFTLDGGDGTVSGNNGEA